MIEGGCASSRSSSFSPLQIGERTERPSTSSAVALPLKFQSPTERGGRNSGRILDHRVEVHRPRLTILC